MSRLGREVVRIANVSGFLGDDLRAMTQVLSGEIQVDYLTGDYLAELTMSILAKSKARDPSKGYATPFLTQMQEALGEISARRIKVVTNAGGLNPFGLRDALRSVAGDLGLDVKIGVIDGDDLIDRFPELLRSGQRFEHLDLGVAWNLHQEVVSANVYLGSWGIVEALDQGADIVICPRVTDASLVVGPVAYEFGWSRTDFDKLAQAMVVGHILECGTQCSGGNYSFFDPNAMSAPLGFPIAEISEDGTAVITKQPGTGGEITVGTITEQLLYEIGSPAYLGPDVSGRFDTMVVQQVGPNRVEVSQTKGMAPPHDLKVALNYRGGYRNQMSMILTGRHASDKASLACEQLFGSLGGREVFDDIEITYQPPPSLSPTTNQDAQGLLTIVVKSQDQALVGRRFSSAVIALALGSYPGFATTTPPTDAREYAVYWPSLIDRRLITHRVTHDDGRVSLVDDYSPYEAAFGLPSSEPAPQERELGEVLSHGELVACYLGDLCGGRSGDKGGNANVGLWAVNPFAYRYLVDHIDEGWLHEHCVDLSDYPIYRYRLDNLLAVNFVIKGILGEGVASSTRLDPQAKGLSEYLRSLPISIPKALSDTLPHPLWSASS